MVSEKMERKAQDLQARLAIEAQRRYVNWVIKDIQKEEGIKIDYDMAWAICTGQSIDEDTGKPEYEYMLGFKLADPVIQLALFKQRDKEARKQAAFNFAQGLSDEEKKMFYEQIFNEKTAESWKRVYKREKKNAKKGISE